MQLGFVGFVRHWHGLDRVLRGLAAWKGAPRLDLTVVGDGPARVDLEFLAAELGLADRVRFTGLATREEIPSLVAGFDIALQPASVPYASPLKLFEYMAAGQAIIAPDQPNIREVLEQGRTALLFDPANPEAMWQGIETLARDAALRARLGAAARKEVLRRDFTWAGNARRVVALAEGALDGRRCGPPSPRNTAGSRRPGIIRWGREGEGGKFGPWALYGVFEMARSRCCPTDQHSTAASGRAAAGGPMTATGWLYKPWYDDDIGPR